MASGFFGWPLLLMFRSWQPGQLGQPAQRFGVRANLATGLREANVVGAFARNAGPGPEIRLAGKFE